MNGARQDAAHRVEWHRVGRVAGVDEQLLDPTRPERVCGSDVSELTATVEDGVDRRRDAEPIGKPVHGSSEIAGVRDVRRHRGRPSLADATARGYRHRAMCRC